jgi:hypothetical protein
MKGCHMKSFFIIHNIRDGKTWIENYANNPEMLSEVIDRLGENKTIETSLHIIAGPFSKNEAKSKLTEIKSL